MMRTLGYYRLGGAADEQRGPSARGLGGG